MRETFRGDADDHGRVRGRRDLGQPGQVGDAQQRVRRRLGDIDQALDTLEVS